MSLERFKLNTLADKHNAEGKAEKKSVRKKKVGKSKKKKKAKKRK